MRSFLSPDNDGPLTSFLSADDAAAGVKPSNPEAKRLMKIILLGIAAALIAPYIFKKKK